MNKSKRIVKAVVFIVLLIIAIYLAACFMQQDDSLASQPELINTDDESFVDISLTEISTKEEKSDDALLDDESKHQVIPEKNNDDTKPETNDRSGHYEIIPAYDETVLVREAYDERIIVKKGSCESVLVKEAWDEEVWEDGAWYGSDTVEAKVCNGCGGIFYGSISEHMSEHPDHGGWHNEMIPQGEPYWHGSKTVVHHDAVYETICEPDEYTTVHHEAEYKTIHHEERRVWINE